MPGTAVVIPYFQREAGVLLAATRSALAQRDAGPVTVVVCDDGSPVPAAMDLALLSLAERERVVLVRQANSGVAAARNAALDAVPPGAEWIAFLDSDDRWGPDHLARSLAALRVGYDLCFSDVQRDTEALTHFQNAAFPVDRHEPLDALPGLHHFTGDFMAQNLAMSPVSVSSVVMRVDTLGNLRFSDMTFEDLMCWFEVARRGARVAFDATLQVHYGNGNITLTESWKSARALRNRLAYHRIFMRIWRGFALTPPQRAILRRRMAENRRAFCTGVLAMLRDGRVPEWQVAAGFLALDPASLGTLAGRAVTVTVRRLLSQPANTDGMAQTGR